LSNYTFKFPFQKFIPKPWIKSFSEFTTGQKPPICAAKSQYNEYNCDETSE
jgi:hypothetical protein